MASVESSKTYQYTPLGDEQGAIRVLKLVAADSPLVHCELEHVSLYDYDPEFADFLACHHDSATSFLTTRDWHRLHNNPLDPPPDQTQTQELPPTITIPGWTPPSNSNTISNQHNTNHRTPQQPVQTTPEITPRFQWGDFQAVSYCWESDVKEKEIVLHGYRTRVPRNLEALLQRLRQRFVSCRPPKQQQEQNDGPEPETRFWIDAICIDQLNVEEKNQQVGIMHEIYSCAFSLVVWLGEETPSSSGAVDALAQMDYVRDKILGRVSEDGTGVCAAWVRTRYEAWCRGIDWGGVSEFLGRPYWLRMWIIQELALNHHDTLFLCGAKELDRGVISGAMEFCFDLFRQVGSVFDEVAGAAGMLTHERQLELFSSGFGVGSLVRLNALQLREGGLDCALDLSQRARAKDPRDKVFALLGLLPAGMKEWIKVDYAATVSRENVYKQMARALLEHTNRVDSVLSWSYHPPGVEANLPSWVPDWEVKFPRNSLQHLARRCASRGTSSVWTISSNGRRLVCRGILVDEIATLSSTPSESLPFQQTLSQPNPIQGNTAIPHQYETFHSLGQALERTLTADHPRVFASDITPIIRNIFWVDWDVVRNTSPDDLALASFWKYMTLITRNTHWESFDRFRQTNAHYSIFGYPFRGFFLGMHNYQPPPCSWSSSQTGSGFKNVRKGFTEVEASSAAYTSVTLAGRRLATTKRGYLGVVPEEARVGDSVFVLHGCSFPVVLRSEDKDLDPGCYRVVGEAYVDGIMNGEVVLGMERGLYGEVVVTLC